MIIGAKAKQQQQGPWKEGGKDRLRRLETCGQKSRQEDGWEIEFKSTTSHCRKAPYKGQSHRQTTLTEKALKQKVMRITGSVLRSQRQKAISPLHSHAETLPVFSEATTIAPRKRTP